MIPPVLFVAKKGFPFTTHKIKKRTTTTTTTTGNKTTTTKKENLKVIQLT